MADQLERLKNAVADRYAVERVLGQGGSATVYLARDLKLGRQVAIKVLRAEITAAVGAERFIREIKVTAQLQHPHIVSIIDSGIADGLLYYTLPYVSGESLRDLLRRTPQLELDEAIRLTREVADALEYAHEQRVLHRDIKPENILLSDGHAVLTDFGLAKAMHEAGGERITEGGLAMGTPWYMSPEQGGGDTVLDERSDQYSLACMLYEMLAGDPPFPGNTPQMVVARHMSQPAPSVRVVRPTVSPAVDAVLHKALAKSPADRYRTMADFAAALEEARTAPRPPARTDQRRNMVLATVAFLLLAALTLWAPWRRAAPTGGAPVLDPSHVAVLSLSGPGASPELAAFGANLTSRLTDGLGAIDPLTVLSRRAVDPYEKAAVPMDSMARALGIGTFVAGSLEGIGDSLRINLELIDGHTGKQLARTHASATLLERHHLVDAVADTVTNLLRRLLGPEIQKRRSLLATKSVAAFDRVQAGEEQRKVFETQLNEKDLSAAHRSLDAADSLYSAAERLDNGWAEPIVGRARISQSRYMLAKAERVANPARRIHEGLAAAERAVLVAPDDPMALEIRGTLRYWIWRDDRPRDNTAATSVRDSAESDLRRSIDGNPDRSRVLRMLSELVAQSGRPDEALQLAERSYKVDPYLEDTDRTVLRLFDFNFQLERDSAATYWCNEGSKRFNDKPYFYDCQLQLMTWTDRVRPDPPRARALIDSTLASYHASLRPTLEPYLEVRLGVIEARAGHRDSARAMLDRALKATPMTAAILMTAANIHLRLGEKDAGVDLVTQFATQHPEALNAMRQSGGLRALRDDPRIQTALELPQKH